MPNQKHLEVQLLNTPLYVQGTHDGLCTYYSTAMMLVTLFPKFATSFGKIKGEYISKFFSDDPLIKNYEEGKDHRQTLATWFYNGEYVKKAIEILNRIANQSNLNTKFEYLEKGAYESTYSNWIADSIDRGLPVILGWNANDYGDHTVLVTGYWEGKEKWLYVNDPGSGYDLINWESLKRQKK